MDERVARRVVELESLVQQRVAKAKADLEVQIRAHVEMELRQEVENSQKREVQKCCWLGSKNALAACGVT